uniref:Uncharacterized protein LOC114912886 n=1 Tax=Elaeis guineensis var. tenera TaxID=51953 RepID=A0A8N4EXM5_ELAGV|nr:uncharacterized protein LOC114912886 [Elaeis guineensis]
MKVNMTHNESVRTFVDIEHYLVLEDEHREAAKTFDQAFMAKTAGNSKQKGKGKKPWNKKSWKKKGSGKPIEKARPDVKKRGKHGEKKDMTKVECYCCHKLGHFAWDCPEKNKEQQTT